MARLAERITVDPEQCGGRPCIRGMRIRVTDVLDLLANGLTAGAFSDSQHIEDDNWEWVVIDAKCRLRPGMFVAQVVGKSMEPTISDGSYCLFRAPVIGTRQGKIVLVQLRNAIDPDQRRALHCQT